MTPSQYDRVKSGDLLRLDNAIDGGFVGSILVVEKRWNQSFRCLFCYKNGLVKLFVVSCSSYSLVV